ncbi:MFS transporter [Brachybacterium sp. ACRRE]|uniref:MFS transporter n=1 Tax=Brachybacterium sp. ACRRE TaxID=2918184 RepID=UPI001EF2A8F8|nr:MFS transporter [Brachybacterium sp. ACRRE]MCG7310846.1 MFS transporter [Brachybacterium sp. ACRRE]
MQRSTASTPASAPPSTRGPSAQLPRSVLVLAASLLVVTTSEFQVAAMLSSMASDFAVQVSTLGMLVTVYSLGSAVGGPLLARLLHGRGPRAALVGVLLAYAVTEAAAGLVTDPALLYALRTVTGALSGATFGLTLTTGMRASPAPLRSRASAVILAGLMLGTLLGLPLSHALAEIATWRISFLVLAGAAVATAVAVLATVPALPAPGADEDDAPLTEDRGSPLAPLRSRALWLRYLSSFLSIGGAFAAFAFLEPILARAGITGGGATAMMLGFGAAALVVNLAGGRVADDRRARRWLLAGLGLQLAALAAILAMPAAPAAVAVATLGLGASGMALNPLLVTRVTAIAPPDVLVNTVHTSAITLGVAAATALGSVGFGAVGDPGGAVAVGAALTVAAILATTVARK